VERSKRSSLRVRGDVRLVVGTSAIVGSSLFLHPGGGCGVASFLEPRQIAQSGVGSGGGRPGTHCFFSRSCLFCLRDSSVCKLLLFMH
jgi:hypothetical protein